MSEDSIQRRRRGSIGRLIDDVDEGVEAASSTPNSAVDKSFYVKKRRSALAIAPSNTSSNGESMHSKLKQVGALLLLLSIGVVCLLYKEMTSQHTLNTVLKYQNAQLELSLQQKYEGKRAGGGRRELRPTEDGTHSCVLKRPCWKTGSNRFCQTYSRSN